VAFPELAGAIGFGSSGAAPKTGTIDTAAAQDIVIRGQLANSGETITLAAYVVEILKKA